MALLKTSWLFETGLCDHHHLIYFILKLHYTKLNPVKIYYGDFKKINKSKFREPLKVY